MRENTQMTLRNWKRQADMWDNVLQKQAATDGNTTELYLYLLGFHVFAI
jgi:hypothetical protein